MENKNKLNVFNHIPAQLAKENKKFQILKSYPVFVFMIIEDVLNG